MNDSYDGYIRAILIAVISIVSVIIVIIVCTLAFNGTGEKRKPNITTISGNAFLMKSDGQIPLTKSTSMESGDVIVTLADTTVTLRFDGDKYIYIEPDSTVEFTFTPIEKKGNIIVNVSDGSVVCRIDSELRSNESFQVRTPNTINSVDGTVFGVDFRYLSTYNGFDDVMLTKTYCFEGDVVIQMFDRDNAEYESPMSLVEGHHAEMLTCSEEARYNCLNEDFTLDELAPATVRALIQMQSDHTLPYSLVELNEACAVVDEIQATETVTEFEVTMPPETTSEEPSYSFTKYNFSESETDEEDYTELEDDFEGSIYPNSVGNATTTATQTVHVAGGIPTGITIVGTTGTTQTTSAKNSTTNPTTVTTTAPTTASTTMPTTATTQVTTTASSKLQISITTTASSVTTSYSETQPEIQETEAYSEEETESTTTENRKWWEIINSENRRETD